MPWITKDSAAIEIDRRDEPYLTESHKADLRERFLPRFESKAGALLPALHMIQSSYGWVPHQAMIEIAQELGLPAAHVLDTASFYEEYWLRPKGKHVVAVCRSIACEFCGQPEITNAVREHLGIDVGQTTEDGEFTFIELECVGSCGTAPAVIIDHTLHENLTPEIVRQKLDEARAQTHNDH